MRSWVEVSLRQIRANFRAVRALVGESVEVMPVVKADAYRHGAVAVSHALEAEGARWLAEPEDPECTRRFVTIEREKPIPNPYPS